MLLFWKEGKGNMSHRMKATTNRTKIVSFLFLIGMTSATITLEDFCENQTAVTMDNRTCEFGPNNPCRITYEPNMCRRTFGCFNVTDYFVNRTMVCKFACAFMNLARRRFAKPNWNDRFVTRTETNYFWIGVDYLRGSLMEAEMETGDTSGLASDVYRVLNPYDNIKVVFARLSNTYGCTPRNANWDRNAHCPSRTRRAQDELCQVDYAWGCRRMSWFYDQPLDHCSRAFHCDWILEPSAARNWTSICGADCWLSRELFYDFLPSGNSSEDNVDVYLAITRGGGRGYPHSNQMIDVTKLIGKLAASEFLIESARRASELFSVEMAVTSRWCVREKNRVLLNQTSDTGNEQPTVCPGDYPVTPRLARVYPGPGCFPTFCQSGTVEAEPHDANSTEVLQADKCWLWVRCEFDRFYNMYGWRRYDYCFFTKWIFHWTVQWVSADLSTSTTDSELQVVIEESGDSDKEERLGVRGPLNTMYSHYDRFMLLHGYVASRMSIRHTFHNCLQATEGRHRVALVGTDHCPHSNYSSSTDPQLDECQFMFFASRMVRVKASCQFNGTESLDRRCMGLYWMLYTSLYVVDRFNWTFEHTDNPTYRINVTYTIENSVSTRIIAPVLRDRSETYIKNFLADDFPSLDFVELETQMEKI